MTFPLATHQVSSSKRESCMCFPGASPARSVSHLSAAGAARGSGCVLDQPPTRSRAASGLFNPTRSATPADGPFHGGGQGGETRARTLRAPCPAPKRRASCSPALQEPPAGGGHHGVSNGCCITFPDASSLFSPKRTKLSSKRRFLSNS